MFGTGHSGTKFIDQSSLYLLISDQKILDKERKTVLPNQTDIWRVVQGAIDFKFWMGRDCSIVYPINCPELDCIWLPSHWLLLRCMNKIDLKTKTKFNLYLILNKQYDYINKWGNIDGTLRNLWVKKTLKFKDPGLERFLLLKSRIRIRNDSFPFFSMK